MKCRHFFTKIFNHSARGYQRELQLTLSFCFAILGWSIVNATPVKQLDQDGCHPLSYETCGLPFPSNHFTLPDESSLTGLRVNIGDLNLFNGELESSTFPVERINRNDGFSIASPIVFELPAKINKRDLKKDGGNFVKLFDVETGERVPVYVKVSKAANRWRLKKPRYVLQVHPVGKMKFAKEYLAVITTSITDSKNRKMKYPDGLVEELSKSDNLILFNSLGIKSDEVLTFTRFTTRSLADAINPMVKASEYIYEKPHAVRNLRVSKVFLGGDIEYKVKGELQAYNFLDENGHLDHSELERKNGGKKTWVPFIMYLPKLERGETLKGVSQYGHGLMSIKHEARFVVAKQNAELGFATVAIDHSFHGVRAFRDSVNVYTWLPLNRHSIDGYAVAYAMAFQSNLDQMSLLKVLRTSLSKSSELSLPETYIFNISDLPIVYQGSSYGAVQVGAFPSIASDIRGVFFHVGGGNMSMVRAYSKLFSDSKISGLPKDVPGSEYSLLLSLMQQIADPVDTINYSSFYVNGNKAFNVSPRPVALVHSDYDGVVPKESAEAFINAAVLQRYDTHSFDETEVNSGLNVAVKVKSLCLVSRLFLLDGLCNHSAPVFHKTTKKVRESWLNSIVLEDDNTRKENRLSKLSERR